MKIFWVETLIFGILFSSVGALAAEPTPSDTGLHFTASDHVLIIAPHPDDETLGTAGVIQRAKKAGASVKVMFLTNGEFNEISSISYQIKPLLVKSDFLQNGRTRKAEATEVLQAVGLSVQDLVFLGYPDSGTLRIWQGNWGEGKPFKSFFTRINKVLNQDDYSYGKYYRGDNILRDFTDIIEDFHPTKIFVTAPFDINFDHQAAYLYLNLSLLDLRGRTEKMPNVYLYIIHQKRWPMPKKLNPALPLTAPETLQGEKPIHWKVFPLTADEIELKKNMLMHYRTQIAYSKDFMLSFARKNELYLEMTFEDLPHELSDGSLEDPFLQVDTEREAKYRAGRKEILIDIPLKVAMDEMGAVTSDIFGYRRNSKFETMPKLSLRFFGKHLSVKDGRRTVQDSRIICKITSDRILVRIPRTVLKNPEYLFVSTRTSRDIALPGFGAWRILRLEEPHK